MPHCAAFGCTNSSAADESLSFFRFPVKDPSLLKQWIHAIGRQKFSPTKHSRLCSVHFKEEYFELDIYSQIMAQEHTKRRRGRRLKAGSVPTIFGHKHSVSKTTKVRELSRRRAEKAQQEQVSENCGMQSYANII